MPTPSAEQADDDHTHAWASAVNLLQYDADPGPRDMRVGGPGEKRVIDRRERLIDTYARDLLVHVNGYLDRLEAVEAEATRRHSDRVARDFPEHALQAELIVIELAQTAARIVRDAGADQDPKARERLVAATRYQNLRDTGELFLGNPNTLVRDPGDLIAELDRIDRNKHDDK